MAIAIGCDRWHVLKYFDASGAERGFIRISPEIEPAISIQIQTLGLDSGRPHRASNYQFPSVSWTMSVGGLDIAACGHKTSQRMRTFPNVFSRPPPWNSRSFVGIKAYDFINTSTAHHFLRIVRSTRAAKALRYFNIELRPGQVPGAFSPLSQKRGLGLFHAQLFQV